MSPSAPIALVFVLAPVFASPVAACSSRSGTKREGGTNTPAVEAGADAEVLDAAPSAVRSDGAAVDALFVEASGFDSKLDAQLPGEAGIDARTGSAAVDGGEPLIVETECSARHADGHPLCSAPPTYEPVKCDAAIPIAPNVELSMQDSAIGGFGDCAVSPSGMGGPALYYALAVPPGAITRVAARPLRFGTNSSEKERPLMRALSSCKAARSLASRIAGDAMGTVELCFSNTGPDPRRVVVAVSRYSGEAMCEPLLFDLLVETLLESSQCPLGTIS